MPLDTFTCARSDGSVCLTGRLFIFVQLLAHIVGAVAFNNCER
ncbi:hypothetical protein PACID_21120 [Acidipropionibacterium acidipropionici ATCC 4875]|uniref:Uncharacterized protein n=1 Tax=Acidipropionibacterium acidipropionici (strain ATCC 4875 / DSM 20272 / JCM 6432 / NBRC 12425 / NCIMB 8070 / 4) TaxID=1171373 RepID=K7RPI7_ACIA4|nr:hypothetical protein PACID_21120 [Acidipropionibacterium acidipropionici ATCC 4875]